VRGGAAVLALAFATACHGPHYRAHDAVGVELAAPVFVDDEELLDVLAVQVVGTGFAGRDGTPTLVLEVTNQDLEAMSLAVDCSFSDAAGAVVASDDRRWLRLAPQQVVRMPFVAPAGATHVAEVVLGWDR
jgi:hypothetical protein